MRLQPSSSLSRNPIQTNKVKPLFEFDSIGMLVSHLWAGPDWPNDTIMKNVLAPQNQMVDTKYPGL